MTTVNNRTKIIQTLSHNGIDTGGAMSANVNTGFDNVIRSAVDGIGGPPIQDKGTQFCRGGYATQDWTKAIDLISGTLADLTYYVRKSGVPELTGYMKHTIVNPIMHDMSLSIRKGGYATASGKFECRAADETKGFADMFTTLDSQAKTAYQAAARGGQQVVSAAFTPLTNPVSQPIPIFHVMNLEFAINLLLQKECNDGDIGYTCVDAEIDGMTASGSINFQDSAIATSLVTAQRLVGAGRGTLAVTVKQSGGATSKVITIAGVDPEQMNQNDAQDFTGHTVNFSIANSSATPLTLAGTNKIITIADVV